MSAIKKINCLKVSTLVLFLLFFQHIDAQRTVKNPKELGADKYPALDALILQKQKALGGDLAAMLWTDTLVYKKELGEFNTRMPAPLGAASILLTTVLVLQFVDEGKLALDDKVSRYLPVFEKYGKNYITIRHCLTHYTGIQSDGNLKLFEKKKFASLDEEVSFIASREIQSNAGTEFRYSTYGPTIAARILEVITKKKFEMLAQQRLFRVIGMRQTTFSNPDASPPSPASGARGTAEDYVKFLVMLLNGGAYRGQTIISPGSFVELQKLYTPVDQIKGAPKPVAGLSYAMGAWVVGVENDHPEAFTTGGLGGAFPVVDWKRKYAFIVLPKDAPEQKTDPYMPMKAAIDN